MKKVKPTIESLLKTMEELTEELHVTKLELQKKTETLKGLGPFQELIQKGNFQSISNLLINVTKFFIEAMKTGGEVMTDYIIQTKDGKVHDLIRIWASHGKTPVERVHELVLEVAQLKKERDDEIEKKTALYVQCSQFYNTAALSIASGEDLLTSLYKLSEKGLTDRQKKGFKKQISELLKTLKNSLKSAREGKDIT